VHVFPKLTITNNAKLTIIASPLGYDWLEDELFHLKRQGIHTVVSLLEGHEAEELASAKRVHSATPWD
jgi:hypothetical protein